MMSTKVTTHSTHEIAQERGDLILSIVAATMLGFGITLLGISVAYIRDLETLRRIPESIWLFVCGTPTEDPMALPMMIILSILSLALAGGLIFIDKKMPNLRKKFMGQKSA